MDRRTLPLALLSLLASVAHAQSASGPLGEITGVMRDSVTKATIVRGSICTEFVSGSPAQLRVHCAGPDELGRYRIDSVPAGTFTLRAQCSGGTLFTGRRLGEKVVTVVPGASITWDIEASATGCDQRPMERLRRRFSGLYYTDHFETSWFLIDGRTDQHAVADFTHNTGWPEGFHWPQDSSLTHCLRVTFAGTLIGPLYNNRDEMVYSFMVDTTVGAKAVVQEECIKGIERFLPTIRN